MSTLDIKTPNDLQLNNKVIQNRSQELSCREKLTKTRSKEEEVPNHSAPKMEEPRARSMYKYQNIGGQGGCIFIKGADVCLQIPPGALQEKTLISIEVKSAAHSNMTDLEPSTILTPIVSCKPDGLKFKKPVELIVPHCAEFNDIRLHKATAHFVGGDVCVSMDSTDKQDDVRCVLKERHCHIYTTHFSDAVVAISDCLNKRMLIVPFSQRNSKLHVRVWIINDLPSEYTILQQEQEELNFTPFNHNAKFIFEYRHEQCSIKVNFSLNDNIQKEVSKDISIQQLFQKFRNGFDFQLESTVTDGARRFVTVSLLKEPVFQLQKEILDGDDVEKTQVESFDDNEVQEDKMLPTPTESDDIFKRLCVYQRGLFKTISSRLPGIQEQYKTVTSGYFFESVLFEQTFYLLPAIFKNITSLREAIFIKITSFSEDIFWELTPDERELIKRISHFNRGILERISDFQTGILERISVCQTGILGSSSACQTGAFQEMVSLHADIFRRMARFTGDVLKIHPTKQSDISTEVIGFLRGLVQLTLSFTKGNSRSWTRDDNITTVNDAKRDIMETISLFAKDYQTIMPGSKKDFDELISSVESEWRSIFRRVSGFPYFVDWRSRCEDPFKRSSHSSKEHLKKPHRYILGFPEPSWTSSTGFSEPSSTSSTDSGVDDISSSDVTEDIPFDVHSSASSEEHLPTSFEMYPDPFKRSSRSRKEHLKKSSEYTSEHLPTSIEMDLDPFKRSSRSRKEHLKKSSEYTSGGASESSKLSEPEEATAK